MRASERARELAARQLTRSSPAKQVVALAIGRRYRRRRASVTEKENESGDAGANETSCHEPDVTCHILLLELCAALQALASGFADELPRKIF